MKKLYRKKSVQDIQDDIFRNMTADKKIHFGSQLWRLAQELDSRKIHYGRSNRSAPSSRKDRRSA